MYKPKTYSPLLEEDRGLERLQLAEERTRSGCPWSRPSVSGRKRGPSGGCTIATTECKTLVFRYTERLTKAGIQPSVGSKGDPSDNALADP